MSSYAEELESSIMELSEMTAHIENDLELNDFIEHMKLTKDDSKTKVKPVKLVF